MERPGPGSHFTHTHTFMYVHGCTHTWRHARKQACMHANIKTVTHAHKQTHEQIHKQAFKRAPTHTPTVHLLYQRPLVAWKKGPQQRLSLFIRSWTHTHTLTEGHDANATVGYADYSADCAHWEAAAGKVASSFWREGRMRGERAKKLKWDVLCVVW